MSRTNVADFDDEVAPGQAAWRDDREGSYDEEAGEMDDFIEHDGETNEAQFRAHRRALEKTARAQGISVEAAEEFLEIFGQDVETQEMLDLWYSANEVDHGLHGFPVSQEPGAEVRHLGRSRKLAALRVPQHKPQQHSAGRYLWCHLSRNRSGCSACDRQSRKPAAWIRCFLCMLSTWYSCGWEHMVQLWVGAHGTVVGGSTWYS